MKPSYWAAGLYPSWLRVEWSDDQVRRGHLLYTAYGVRDAETVAQESEFQRRSRARRERRSA